MLSLLAIHAPDIDWQNLGIICRRVSPWFAMVAFPLVMYRAVTTWIKPLPETKDPIEGELLWRRKQRLGTGLFMWGMYVLAAGLGSAQGAYLNNKVGPVTALILGLHIVSIIVCTWAWPRIGGDYLEEHAGGDTPSEDAIHRKGGDKRRRYR